MIKIKIEFAFQDINHLPKGFLCPTSRVKPWGTGHAILSAQHLINEPFIVINGDDFYGRKTFEVVANYYKQETRKFSMVSFRLDNTLSTNGTVSRGICSVINQELNTVIETHGLELVENGIVSKNKDLVLDGSEKVSMNVWGFTPSLFKYLNEMFIDFLNAEGKELKSEFLIPTVVNNLIQSEKETVHVLNSDENWFGVTYKEDHPFVTKKIKDLISNGVYPKSLY